MSCGIRSKSGRHGRSRKNNSMTEQIHSTANEPNAAIRLTMMPPDTNAHGTVFGGVILSYIDVAGGVESIRHTRHNRFVTVAMKEVIFHQPVYIGDLVSFYVRTLKVGNTSITVHVDVEAGRFEDPGVVVKVTEAEVTFVAIDEKGTKIAIAKLG